MPASARRARPRGQASGGDGAGEVGGGEGSGVEGGGDRRRVEGETARRFSLPPEHRHA